MGWFSWLRRGAVKQGQDRCPEAVVAIPTVRFDPQQVSSQVEQAVRDLVAAESEIPAAQRREAYSAAIASVRRGRDAASLSAWLLRKIDGLPKASAHRISRTIHNRATFMMRLARELKSGVEFGDWLHSGAPCYLVAGGAIAEGWENQADAHKQLSGHRFRLIDGVLIEGSRCWPGWDVGCKCTWSAVIPGFT